MKLAIQSIIFAAACSCFMGQLQGQESGVKVSILLHEDGTKTVTKLDPDQHTSEETTYFLNEKVQKRVVYTLDENNLPQAAVVYGAKGAPERKLVLKYDPLNRLAEEQDYTLDDKLILRFVYEYGKGGQLVKIRAYDANGNEKSSTPTHNSTTSPRTQH